MRKAVKKPVAKKKIVKSSVNYKQRCAELESMLESMAESALNSLSISLSVAAENNKLKDSVREYEKYIAITALSQYQKSQENELPF